MTDIVQKAKNDGFVKTLMGRIRYLPELKSPKQPIRAFGERVALNTPIQGFAADIIKLAMVNVFRRLENYKSRLILQVHDELIIEAYRDEAEEIAEILKQEMEKCVNLSIPLEVSVGVGRNWYEAKA